MTEKKITRKEKLEMILAIEEVAANDVLKTFVENEIASLKAKAEKAKERAEKKKTETDEYCDKIYDIIAEKGVVTVQELQSILSVDEPEITSAKIVSRLSKLVNSEKIAKKEKTIDKSKRMTYFINVAE